MNVSRAPGAPCGSVFGRFFFFMECIVGSQAHDWLKMVVLFAENDEFVLETTRILVENGGILIENGGYFIENKGFSLKMVDFGAQNETFQLNIGKSMKNQ